MQIQWLGHSAFRITGKGAVIIIDPFLSGNPKFSGDAAGITSDTTHVLVTHGHNDHFGDTVDILRRTGATFVSTAELAGYVGSEVEGAKIHGMNTGGTHDFGPFAVSMVQAFHSSSYTAPDGRVIYGGMPTGLIVHIDGHRVYHVGDTVSFGDMARIARRYNPDIGIVPIGDNFTMGPDEAADTVNEFFAFKTVIPCHYMTFPVLEQSAEGFRAKVSKGEVKILEPMETLEI
jgi:L-ascorbate metabolism protein UlaG (beta-lactamase superfamily)